MNNSDEYKQIKRHVEEHVKQNHNTLSGEVAPLNGVEIEDPGLIQTIKHLVIDESGMLVNPNSLLVDPNLLQDEKPRSSIVVRKNRGKSYKLSKRVVTQNPVNPPANTIDLSSREQKNLDIITANIINATNNNAHKDGTGANPLKIKPEKHHLSSKPLLSHKNIKVDRRVKCPLCKHRTEYNVLFVHIQVSHPEENPKIVMAEFNREYEKKKEEETIDRELNELVKDYEKLKQSQNESRDGGKYLGYMSRENGKFGSLPLYDDYSDESNSE